ncbi:MAG: serine hydrolase domain-containing protein [Halobacteriaceae archaeon]
MDPTYPGAEWERVDPGRAGVDPDRLLDGRAHLEDPSVEDDPRAGRFDGENPYRAVVVRGGRVVAEWNRGLEADERVQLASATKSVFATLLGVAVEEGMLPAVDARLADHFPAALDVLPGEGPKEGRHARRKDREITLAQLAANTSGYLKPGEPPGEVKHYQTFGMNVLAHAVAETYGMYDVADPEGSPGLPLLMDTRLRAPMRGSWGYYAMNFDHPEGAKTANFGYYPGIEATALDMARLGWLWCNYGEWDGERLAPADWLREATAPVSAEREEDPEKDMLEGYGYGFWTNREGALWPSLPERSFAARGAGGMVIWVCPPLDLVVVEGPGPFYYGEMDEYLFPAVVDAVEQG